MSRKIFNDMMDSIGIVYRFKEFCGITLDRDAAQLLGISEKNFNNQKKRGSISEKIIDWSIHKNVDLNWLITGRGGITRNADMENKLDQSQALRMLLDIFESNDDKAKYAIYKNLEYFSGAIKRFQADRRRVVDPDWPPEKERRGGGPKAQAG